MAPRNSNRKGAVRNGTHNHASPKASVSAVGYLRVSDTQQAKSIDSQRGEVEAWAIANRYVIVEWYIDDGVSGWKSEKRGGFQDLIADAQAGKFKAIICWDQDRFSRFPVLEANHYWYLLDHAGVHIATVNQGRLDFRDLGGWLKASIAQHGNAEFSVKIARNSLRGRRDSAQNGNYVNGGNIAMGMDKLVYDDRGEFVKRIRWNETFKKPKRWRCELAPSEDTKAANAVRGAFEKVGREDASCCGIAKELNDQNVSTRNGQPWRHDTVKAMLQNPTYCGRARFGENTKGTFYQLGDDCEIVEANGERTRQAPIYDDTPVHEGLVSPELFDRVQANLAARTAKRAKPKRRSPYILTGVIRCGHCGSEMYGESCRGHAYYRCSGKHGKCRRLRIKRHDIESYVLSAVRNRFLSGDSIERLKSAMRKQLTTKRKRRTGDTKRLKKAIDKLNCNIDRGLENLLLCDPQNVPAMEAKLNGWRTERVELQTRLDAAECCQNASKASTDETIAKAVSRLFRLRETLSEANPATVRNAMKEIIAGMSLWWTPTGKRSYELARGVIEFSGVIAGSGSVTCH